MTSRRDRATAAQVTVIQNLIRSHVITPGEREKFMAALANGMRKARASEAFEWLKTTIPARKAFERRGVLCPLCLDADAVMMVIEEEDGTVIGTNHRATVATRREVPACPGCSDGREMVE